jgi:hypothetical protein
MSKKPKRLRRGASREAVTKAWDRDQQELRRDLPRKTVEWLRGDGSGLPPGDAKHHGLLRLYRLGMKFGMHLPPPEVWRAFYFQEIVPSFNVLSPSVKLCLECGRRFARVDGRSKDSDFDSDNCEAAYERRQERARASSLPTTRKAKAAAAELRLHRKSCPRCKNQKPCADSDGLEMRLHFTSCTRCLANKPCKESKKWIRRIAKFSRPSADPADDIGVQLDDDLEWGE